MRCLHSWGRHAPIFFALFTGALPAWGWEPYFRMEVFGHAEPVAIKQFAGDWRGRLQAGDDALTHNRIETGARRGPWTLAFVYRYDYEIKANRSSAEFYHQVANRTALVPGQTFDLDVRGWHQRSQGLRVAHAWTLNPALQVELGLSLLNGIRLTDGHITGNASVAAANDYDYNAAVEYDYSEDHLFERPVTRPSALGYSSDIRVSWAPSESWHLSASVEDALGELRWTRSPFTTASVTSAIKQFGPDGFAEYNPSLTGLESERTHRQRMHSRGSLDARWHSTPARAWGGRLRLTEVGYFPALYVQNQIASGISWQAEALPLQKALGVGLQWQGLQIQFSSDRLKLDAAHYLNMQFAYTRSF